MNFFNMAAKSLRRSLKDLINGSRSAIKCYFWAGGHFLRSSYHTNALRAKSTGLLQIIPQTSTAGIFVRASQRHISRTMTLRKLFHPLQEKVEDYRNKVTVVGIGQVGMAAVIALITENITNNIAMVDIDVGRLKGELMDLQHGMAYLGIKPQIQCSTDFSITADSKIIIVTSGVRQEGEETRLDLVQRNTEVLKDTIHKLVQYSPNSTLLIVTNPCDVMTYVAWKISGFPVNRVIGSGTNLDTSRFRFLLAENLGIPLTACHGYVIGEHGDSSVPVWSSVSVAGVKLSDYNTIVGKTNDTETMQHIHADVKEAALRVRNSKGYTSWAIGLSLADISRSILTNSYSIHPISTNVNGYHGFEKDVFLSLPCTLGSHGVCDVIQLPLDNEEMEALAKSAGVLEKVQMSLNL